MSRGRHSRPRAKSGGLAGLIAIAVAGGSVALAASEPSGRVLRLCVVGLAIVSSFQLLMLSRLQRSSTRSMARTEDRLRILEQRNRDEGHELHRRVLEGVAREGELRRAVEVLVDEIGRLRASLEGFVPVLTNEFPAVSVAATSVAPAAAAGPASDVAPAFDIPLIQRVFAAQEEVAAPLPPAAANLVAPVAPLMQPAATVQPAQPVQPLAVPLQPAVSAPAAAAAATATATATAPGDPADTWRAPTRPEYLPTAAPVEVPVTSWVVRELQLEQPGAAVTMRILDLTTPTSVPTAPPAAPGIAESAGPDEAEYEPTSTWSAFARPA